MASVKPGRYTLGVLVDSLTGIAGYQMDVWQGVSDVADEKGYNLITIAGGQLEFSPLNEFEQYRNFGYDFVDRKLIDGIVLCGGTMGNSVSHVKFQAFCDRFAGIPMVSVGPAAGNVPAVLVDNDVGMRQIIQHLVVEHEYKELAFIRGPEGNSDADRRYEIFQNVMRENKIPIDPDLVYVGDFNDASGAAAVRHWISKKKKIRAIISSNDSMALGAIEVLHEQGVRIPYDTAIIGFDDIEAATSVMPALTTVRQPVYEQGRKAAELVVELLEGRSIGQKTLLEPETVIRLSCGCQTPIVQNAAIPWGTLVPFSEATYSVQWCDRLVDRMEKVLQNLRHKPERKALNELIGTFREEVMNGSRDVFIPYLDRLLRAAVANKDYVELWQEVISLFRAYFVPGIGEETRLLRSSNLLHQARVIIGDMAVQIQHQNRTNLQKETNLLFEVGHDLITNFNLDELADAIFRSFPRTGINGAYLCVFENGYAAEGQSRAVLAFSEGRRHPIPKEGTLFQTKSILPESIFPVNRRFVWVLEPLFFRTERLGYMIFEQGPRDGLVYESLFTQLCTSLEGAMLIKRNKLVELALEQRSRNIDTLVRPMLDSIQAVTSISSRQTEDIRDLEGANRESNEKIKGTLKIVDRIAEVLKRTSELAAAIDDISETINLVALNASIEAAHAGKFGSGFTVIASEIRKLSDSTKKNASEISNFLGSIRGGIGDFVSANQETYATFKRLEKNVEAVADSFVEIVKRMTELSDGSRKILDVMGNR